MRQSYLDKMSGSQVKRAKFKEVDAYKMNLTAKVNHEQSLMSLVTWYDDYAEVLAKDDEYQIIDKEYKENRKMAEEAKEPRSKMDCDKARWEIISRLNKRHSELKKDYEDNRQNTSRKDKLVSSCESTKGS